MTDSKRVTREGLAAAMDAVDPPVTGDEYDEDRQEHREYADAIFDALPTPPASETWAAILAKPHEEQDALIEGVESPPLSVTREDDASSRGPLLGRTPVDRADEPRSPVESQGNVGIARHSFDECDCVPGHRCDCWDVRAELRRAEWIEGWMQGAGQMTTWPPEALHAEAVRQYERRAALDAAPAASEDVDAAWVVDLHRTEQAMGRDCVNAREHALIEAAIRAEGLDVDAVLDAVRAYGDARADVAYGRATRKAIDLAWERLLTVAHIPPMDARLTEADR